jgi:L-talarate/galactarate dehydratase
MLITGIATRSVRLPQHQRRSLPRTDDPPHAESQTETALIAEIRTDANLSGSGCITTRQPRIVQTIIEDLFVPALVGSDPQSTERHFARASQRCPEIARGGSEAAAYAVLDIAMWDLKSQASQLPLFQLLGGCRESTPAYIVESSGPNLSADQVIELAKPLLDQGLKGLWVGVNGRDPIRDANKLQHVRDQLGEEIWLGVCGHHGLDLNTALAFGRFLEEEMDADVYADPCPATDFTAFARLAAELELAVAAGASLGFDHFAELVTQTRVNVLRPDLTRVGGITPLLKIAALAELNHRVVIPMGNMEVTSHVACGLPVMNAIDFDRRMESFRTESWKLANGEIIAGKSPGLMMRSF